MRSMNTTSARKQHLDDAELLLNIAEIILQDDEEGVEKEICLRLITALFVLTVKLLLREVIRRVRKRMRKNEKGGVRRWEQP